MPPMRISSWHSHRTGEPSIDADVLRGDVGSAVRGEKGCGGSNFFTAGIALKGDTGAALFDLRETVDPARQDVVHADVVRRISVGKDLGERSQPGAENGRGGEQSAWLECPGSRNVEDYATILLLH